MRHIILMNDYECFPIWEKNNGLKNFDSHELDIPKSLADEIEAWGDEYETTYNKNNPANSGLRSIEARKQFIEKGHKLHKELKAALGDKCKIVYKDVDGMEFD